ncbi:hypothetical protein PQ459_16200 [Chryseobacterium sp. KACC 21268]|nr:hypothetical protein PQ459_16200 [Chryseobacterium sp. KACC 21268]
MKNIIITSLLLLVSLAIKAQNVTYEKLDSLSTSITNYQLSANDKSYDENGNKVIVSFSESNFSIQYNSGLATNSVYKNVNGKERMELVEDLDLSKVTSIKIIPLEGSFCKYHLEFPENSATEQTYEDGNLIETAKVSSIDLYSAHDKYGVYDKIIQMCELLKKNKTEDKIADTSKDWSRARSENSVESYQNFINKYPNSLYSAETQNLLAYRKKAIQAETDRLEKVRLENLRIQEEKDRIERERLAAIAEAERLKVERNIAFFSFRVGYVTPTNADSKELSGTVSAVMNPGESQIYSTGKFGLKSGFSAGFTGIFNLEFINKNLPSWIGIGIPADFNVAMMQYSWDDLSSSDYNYEDAKYSLWGVASAGAGLSLSFHPAPRLFIDVFGRADYYGSFGGNYKANVKSVDGIGEFETKIERESGSGADSFGFAKTLGLNVRYTSFLLGIELKNDIVDNAKFSEKIGSSGSLPIENKGLNLSYLQVTLGYIF